MQEDIIVVRPSKERDPDGSLLQETLNVHLALEHACSIRGLLVYVLGVLSAPVWIAAAVPTRVPHGVRSVALAAWAMCLSGVVWAIISEWKLRRKRAALLEALGSAPTAETRGSDCPS